MNETTSPSRASDVPWPTHDTRARVPDTSMLPGSEKAPPAAVDMLKHAVQGTHDAIDRLADSAAPAVQRLGERASVAGDALHAKTAQLRVTRDEWVEDARASVRASPLAAMAVALALGALIGRFTR